MTNAYQVSIAARQLLEGYTAAMQPLCRREGLAPNGVDILLFLANNPGLDTARDVCTYRRASSPSTWRSWCRRGICCGSPPPGTGASAAWCAPRRPGLWCSRAVSCRRRFSAAWPGAWSRRTWRPSDAAWRASAGIYPK